MESEDIMSEEEVDLISEDDNEEEVENIESDDEDGPEEVLFSISKQEVLDEKKLINDAFKDAKNELKAKRRNIEQRNIQQKKSKLTQLPQAVIDKLDASLEEKKSDDQEVKLKKKSKPKSMAKPSLMAYNSTSEFSVHSLDTKTQVKSVPNFKNEMLSKKRIKRKSLSTVVNNLKKRNETINKSN